MSSNLLRNGAIVPIDIGVPKSYQAALERQGQQVPQPRRLNALIDTGASITAINEQAAAAIGLPVTGTIQVTGVGGTSDRPIHAASLVLDSSIVFDSIEVVQVPLPRLDALVGRDILAKVDFLYQGPADVFSLEQDGVGVGSSIFSRDSLLLGGGIALVLGIGIALLK